MLLNANNKIDHKAEHNNKNNDSMSANKRSTQQLFSGIETNNDS
jgi:hypothetical protein